MYKEIELDIDLSSDEFCEILRTQIEDRLDKLEPYLLDGLWQKGDRAEYSEDTLVINEITHNSGNEYTMYYEYEWFAFMGCKDMDHGDTADGSVDFKFQNGRLIFNFLILERPSTENEL